MAVSVYAQLTFGFVAIVWIRGRSGSVIGLHERDQVMGRPWSRPLDPRPARWAGTIGAGFPAFTWVWP